jgi:hypothetical protein
VRKAAQTEITIELKSLLKSESKNYNLKLQPLDLANHTVTYRQITFAPYLVRVKQLPRVASITEKQIALASVTKLAVSSATRKIAVVAVRALTRVEK